MGSICRFTQLLHEEWRMENEREQKGEKKQSVWRALVMYVLPAVIE